MYNTFLLKSGVKRQKFDLFEIENINTDDIFSINIYSNSFVNTEINICKDNRLLTVACYHDYFAESAIQKERKVVQFQLPDHIDIKRHFSQEFSNNHYLFFNLENRPVPCPYYF